MLEISQALRSEETLRQLMRIILLKPCSAIIEYILPLLNHTTQFSDYIDTSRYISECSVLHPLPSIRLAAKRHLHGSNAKHAHCIPVSYDFFELKVQCAANQLAKGNADISSTMQYSSDRIHMNMSDEEKIEFLSGVILADAQLKINIRLELDKSM